MGIKYWYITGMLTRFIKLLLRFLLRLLYRVEVSGIDNYYKAGKRVLIIANHTSLLDGVLLYAWLPETPTFAINTQIAERRLYKPFLKFVDLFVMNTLNPLSLKSMIKFLREDHKAVIFPEGRITVTGSLMKTYEGPGLVADKSDAMILPIAIDGCQFSHFSYMRGRGRIIFFPKIRMIMLPPARIKLAPDIATHERRKAATLQLQDMMYRLAYTVVNQRMTLYAALIHASARHGKNTVILEDIRRQPLTYRQLLVRSVVLGRKLSDYTRAHEYTGILMPNISDTIVTFMALQFLGRTPAMLNYTLGLQALVQACQIGNIKTVLTSRKFIDTAKLHELAKGLAQQMTLLYLEDLAAGITLSDKFSGWAHSLFIQRHYRKVSGPHDPEQPAVLLFTSGSEGAPKGVVLSHRNLLANYAQVSCHINYGERDLIFSCLPLFHSFGLNAGCLMPLFGGCRIFLYLTPLHYRRIPELVYELDATILFSTNTFFKGYARYANPYDFRTLRYAVAGAEKLRGETQKLWMEKFGIRILEGFGVTEASPVITVNTPLTIKAGTVGRPMTDIECYLEPAEGIERGGRLVVKGPNIMSGYLLHGQDGLAPPASSRGPGWHDTGDIADIDHEGFITILGRAKRFAKIGGEMVSLTAVEDLALQAWPGLNHAALNLPDEKKGEKIVLYTTYAQAARKELVDFARHRGIGEIYIPKQVIYLRKLPQLGTGKYDYLALAEMAKAARISVDDEDGI